MDYFTSVERQLNEAIRLQAHGRWRARLYGRGRRLALAAALCAVTAGTALAATGVIPFGSAVEAPHDLSPRVGSGVPAPGGSVLLSLRYPDPEGGPPWGMRVIRTTRGLLCVQVARVQGGQLGVLGIDGQFHDDGRFHPLPSSLLPDAGGGGAMFATAQSNGTAPVAACQLPSQPFITDDYGVARSGGGPLDTTHMARERLRDLDFGLLGPEARTVSYSISGHVTTEPVVAGVGAFLLVTPTASHGPVATAVGTVGSFGALTPMRPLSAIEYLLRGRLCERTRPGLRSRRPCPAQRSLYGRGAPGARRMHIALRVSLDVADHRVRAATVTFRAPLAVSGAGESYELRAPSAPCHRPGSGFVSQNTDRDIDAGETVRIRLGDPFGGACRGRSARLQVFYNAAGSQPREVGSVLVHEPAGDNAEPSHLVHLR